jgi:hypothetical protein
MLVENDEVKSREGIACDHCVRKDAEENSNRAVALEDALADMALKAGTGLDRISAHMHIDPL